MNLFKSILEDVASFVLEQTGSKIALEEFVVNETRKEFEGDYTLLIFPLVRSFKKSPEATGHLIGEQLKTVNKYVISFNVIKGFLNLEMSPSYWIEGLNAIHQIKDFGKSERKGEKVMVEYSSPNTNKPLHLGHIRNILLGWSVSRILDAAGYDVVKTQVVNDRGIAVCKSMLAWEKFSAGETPESSGMKGDHLVGKYYVEFDKHFKEEYASWQKSDEGKKKFENSGMDDREKFFSSFKNVGVG